MKARSFLLFGGSFLLLGIIACNVNVNDGTGNGHDGIQPDSGTTITTHSETRSESHSDFELKGGIHSESNTSTHSTTTVGKTLTFAQQVTQWSSDIFPDYAPVEMDAMEAYPKYKNASETIFRRLRVKNPISNDYGKAVYPRVLIKAYRFASTTALTKDVEEWLNSLGSEIKNIELGQSVKKVKSPPLLCAVVDNDFIVAQWGCVYQSKEWTATEALFFEKMKFSGAAYAWKIKCDGGELEYLIGGSK